MKEKPDVTLEQYNLYRQLQADFEEFDADKSWSDEIWWDMGLKQYCKWQKSLVNAKHVRKWIGDKLADYVEERWTIGTKENTVNEIIDAIVRVSTRKEKENKRLYGQTPHYRPLRVFTKEEILEQYEQAYRKGYDPSK